MIFYLFLMSTVNQLLRRRSKRIKKVRKFRNKHLESCPFKKAIITKTFVMSPKKPNSALRKVAMAVLPKKYKKLIVYIPGIGHNLKQFSRIVIKGGRVKDLPGVFYKAVRGAQDFSPREHFLRKKARSKYGVRKKLIF